MSQYFTGLDDLRAQLEADGWRIYPNHLNCDDLEAWIASTGDAPAVIEYLAAKYMDNDTARKARVLSKVEGMLPDLFAAIAAMKAAA